MKQERLLKNDILNILSKQVSGGNSYPKIFFGGSAGDVWSGNNADEDAGITQKFYFKEPKDKNKIPKFFQDKELKKPLLKSDSDPLNESWLDMVNNLDMEQLFNLEKAKAPAKAKIPAKSPAKAKAKAPKAKEELEQIKKDYGTPAKAKDSIIEDWGSDVNNISLEQENKTLTKKINNLVNSKKIKTINLDNVITFDKKLTDELMKIYSFQKVLDGYNNFVEYLNDNDKDIGFKSLKDYFTIRDGIITPTATFYKSSKSLINKIKKEWEKSATHKMPDGAVHTGKSHTKDSKVVKPAPKKTTNKKYGTTAPVCETKKGKFQKCNPWIQHVRDFRFNNNVEGLTVAQVNKEAKKSYTPVTKSKAPKKKKDEEDDKKPAPAKEKKIYTQKRRKELISKDKARRDTKKKELLEDLRKASQMLDKSTDPNIIKEATEFMRKTQAELEKLNKTKKSTKKSTKKCPIGKKRNPDSGRCKKIVCPSGKELNEKSGRCNKYKFTKEDKEIFKFIGEEEVRLNIKATKKKKKREPTAWDLHLKQIRLENPSIKGKAIMKLASSTYTKGGQCESENKEPTKPVNKQDFLKQSLNFHPDKNDDCPEEAHKKFVRLQKLYEEDNKDVIRNNEKILAEIFDTIDIFTNEFENIFNDEEMSLDEKQNKFKEIIFKIEQYTEYLTENYNDLDGGTQIRFRYALEKMEEHYLEQYRLLQDGKPNIVLDFDDDEDLDQIQEDIEEEKMDKILQEALFVEEEPLFNPEFAYKPTPQSDFLPDYLLKQSPQFQTNPSNYPYDSILKYDSIDKEPEVEIEDNINVSVEEKPKKINKRKTPLNLRLYQAFYKILKKHNPELNRPDIIEFWKANRESYIDMLIYSIDKVGGNLEDQENYVNMFNFIGGNLSLFKGSDNYSENKIPTTDDLLNVDNWTNTVENIATSVYDTLEDVFDFIF